MEDDAETAKDAPGMLDSAKRLLTTLVEIVETRLEIVANELEEQRVRFAQWVAVILATALLSGLAVFFASLFVVAMFWDTYRLGVVGGLALFYLVLAIIAAMVLRRRIKHRPHVFATILAELRKDRERLGPGP